MFGKKTYYYNLIFKMISITVKMINLFLILNPFYITYPYLWIIYLTTITPVHD